MNASNKPKVTDDSQTTKEAETETEPDADTDAESGAETETEDEVHLEKDELFHLLKSERRRRSLQYLLEAESEPVRMRTLAEAVAAQEYNKTVETLHSDERQRVYITLYQSHLPQLDRAGVIDYNQSRGRIETTPLIEAFEPYLETPSEPDEPFDASMTPALAGFGSGGVATLLLLQVTGAAITAGLTAMVALVLSGWWAMSRR